MSAIIQPFSSDWYFGMLDMYIKLTYIRTYIQNKIKGMFYSCYKIEILLENVKKKLVRLGIEPGPLACEASVITTTLPNRG